LDEDGVPGVESTWIAVDQPAPDDTGNPGPGELVVVSPPVLIADLTDPFAVGTVVTMSAATIGGGVAPITLDNYIEEADDAIGTGATLSDHIPGDPLDIALVGKYLRAVTEATDSDAPPEVVTGESPWSAVAVYDPDPVTAPVINDIRWIEQATDEWLAVFDLDPMLTGDYTNLAGNLQVQWARKPANPLGTPSWEVMTPYNSTDGEESAVSGVSGEWKADTTSTATTGNWIRPNRRMPEYRPPDTYNFLIRYSEDAGANWSPIAELDVLNSVDGFPWFDTPVGVGDYWKSIERSPGAALGTPSFYGEGHQLYRGMSTGLTHSIVYLFGDMCGVNKSNNFGDTWFRVGRSGLRQFAFESGAVDPHDPDRVIAYGHSAWLHTTNPYDDYRGFWLSTDGGETWTLRQLVTVSAPGEHQAHRDFTYDPNTLGGASSTRDWYYMQTINGTGSQFWKSTDGGSTWAVAGAQMSTTKFGKVHMTQHHPVTANKIYVAADNGLWVTTNGGVSGSGSWVRVGTGLPTGKCRAVYLNSDGTTIIVSVSGAVWRSTNSGSTWSSIYSTQPVTDIAVDWNTSGGYTVYAKTSGPSAVGNYQDMAVSTNSGSSFSTGKARTPSPGYSGDQYYQRLGGSGNVNGMLVHPLNAGVILNHNVSRFFKSTDKGQIWFDATKGSTGMNTSLVPYTFMIDPNDAGRWCFGAQDVGFVEVLDYGGGGLQFSNITQAQLEAIPGIGVANRSSATAACILPTGRMIVAVGANVQGLFYKSPGATSWTATGTGAVIPYINYHPTTTSAVGAGGYKSTNSGSSWSVFPSSMRFVSMHPDGTGFFTVGNTSVYRSTNWHTASPTFVPFYQITGTFYAVGTAYPIIKCDPTNNTRIYCLDNNRDFVRVTNSGSTFNSATVLSLPLRGETSLTAAEFRMGQIAADYNQAGLVYAHVAMAGVPNIFRGQITGSSIVWEDITSNSSMWNMNSIDVHEETGDVMIGGGEGMWVYPPPYSVANSIWENLPEPVDEILPT
jgi:hypothetical protein